MLPALAGDAAAATSGHHGRQITFNVMGTMILDDRLLSIPYFLLFSPPGKDVPVLHRDFVCK